VGKRADLAREPAILDGVTIEKNVVAPPRAYRQQRMVAHGWTNKEIVFASHDSLVPNMPTAFGVSATPGYDPAIDRRFTHLVDVAESEHLIPRLLTWLDVEWVVLPPDAVAAAGLPKVGEAPDKLSVLVHNERRRPRAFVAPRWQWTNDDEAVLRGEPTPGLVRLMGEGDDGGFDGPYTPCTVEGRFEEVVTVTCDSPTGGYAVLLDAWAPGWTATVDGAPSEIIRADTVVRAVSLPPGAHVVRFEYETPGLRQGALVSATAWGAWLALLYMARRRRSA
jgi:hypothetical protein